jgi:dihydroorotate dehydrogenase
MSNVPKWWPERPAIYDKDISYKENFEKGPFFDGDFLERRWKPQDEWIDFLGHKIASPVGVPAGPLLNSKWTTLAARLGFDVVTYKTIRSAEHIGHPLPNVVFVDTEGALTGDRMGETLHIADHDPETMAELGITNSFGMPSPDEAYLRNDIPQANSGLKKGQVLIVSVVGTPREGEDFIQDFVKTAQFAVEAGAQIIEANFSCPNVVSGEGNICYNPESVYEIASQIVKAIGDIPLIIKVGYYADSEIMKKVFVAAARAGVRSICGINTIGMHVVDKSGKPALGENRIKSGICGEPIQEAAIDFVKHAVDINEKEKLDLEIIGVGGITLPEHFDRFIHEGAKVAMTATGMMWDPYLAMRYHEIT